MLKCKQVLKLFSRSLATLACAALILSAAAITFDAGFVNSAYAAKLSKEQGKGQMAKPAGNNACDPNGHGYGADHMVTNWLFGLGDFFKSWVDEVEQRGVLGAITGIGAGIVNVGARYATNIGDLGYVPATGSNLLYPATVECDHPPIRF